MIRVNLASRASRIPCLIAGHKWSSPTRPRVCLRPACRGRTEQRREWRPDARP